MLEGVLTLLGQMEPIWVIMTIVVGIILGAMSKEIEFEWKSLYLLFFFYVPFAVARLVAFLLAGVPAVAGTGMIGVLFFILYAVTFYIGRKAARKFGK